MRGSGNLTAQNAAVISAVPDLLGSTAAELRCPRTEVAHLRSLTGSNSCADCHGGGGDTHADSEGAPVSGVVGGREGAGGRAREWGGDGHVSGVAAAAHFPFGSPVSAVRLGATAAVTHGRLPAQRMVVQFPPAVSSPAAVPLPPVVSSRLAQHHENVRQLAMRQELEGVPIFSGDCQYVPLLPLERDLGREAALDEYAMGLKGRDAATRRAFVWEVEAKFDDRWRFGIPDAADRRRPGKLYSKWSPIYRAFQVEYSKRGAGLGVERVVSFVKSKSKGRGGAIAVYKLANQDYPASKKGVCVFDVSRLVNHFA